MQITFQGHDLRGVVGLIDESVLIIGTMPLGYYNEGFMIVWLDMIPGLQVQVFLKQ